MTALVGTSGFVIILKKITLAERWVNVVKTNRYGWNKRHTEGPTMYFIIAPAHPHAAWEVV